MPKSFTEWLFLNEESVPEWSALFASAGATTSRTPSPYDRPNAVRLGFDHDHHEIEFEFRYIDTEPLSPWTTNRGVVLEIGRHSFRIYKVRYTYSIDLKGTVPRKAFTDLKSRLPDAIESLSSNTKNLRANNYKIVAVVLDVVCTALAEVAAADEAVPA